MYLARCSRSVGHSCGKAVVHHVVALDAERVLDELGGAVAVDRLLEKIDHGVRFTVLRLRR